MQSSTGHHVPAWAEVEDQSVRPQWKGASVDVVGRAWMLKRKALGLKVAGHFAAVLAFEIAALTSWLQL
jgi:hypothetical protein